MRIGFIGCGNMAQAMIGGITASKLVQASNITAFDKSNDALLKASNNLGIVKADNNQQVVAQSDVIILAVKPQFYADVIAEIAADVGDNQIIVTIAPGQTLDSLAAAFGKPVKIVRTMPNTPALVGEGMAGVCKNEHVTQLELDKVVEIFGAFGKVCVVEERLMDGVVAVSGSSPAYVYMFIEALADGAVLSGIPRADAYQFAAQAVLGSAKMVLETGIHPAELKDQVCSPGGTTIEAVRKLEETGFRSSVLEAMSACVEKAKNLQKK